MKNQEISHPKTIHISKVVWLKDEQNVRVLFVNYAPIFSYVKQDLMAEKFICISLIKDGLAKQKEVAMAFGYGEIGRAHV